LLTEGAKGTAALAELMLWIEIDHRREQAKTGERLVALFAEKAFPLLNVADWNKVAGQVSRSKPSDPKLKSVVVIDFNVPAARDLLKMPTMISAAAETVNVLGKNSSVLLAIMPGAPKEDAKTSAFDDEVQIARKL